MSLLLLASICVQNEGNPSAFMYCDFLFGICFLSVFLRGWSSALGEDSYDFVFVIFYPSLAPFICTLNGLLY